MAYVYQQPFKLRAGAEPYFSFIRAYVEKRSIEFIIVCSLQEIADFDIQLDSQLARLHI